VCQIATVLSAPPSTISGHLTELRQAGVIDERRTGKWIHCRLVDDPAVGALIGPLIAAVDVDVDVRRDAKAAATIRRQPLAAICASALSPAKGLR
jgi:DNA-binding transcriptional ArsR family regulator